MEVLIAIPTYKRIKKLERCLKSIRNSSFQKIGVVVVADNRDYETKLYLEKVFPDAKCLVQNSHKFVVGAWNRVVKEVFIPEGFSYFLGLCDDVELKRYTLEKALECHQKHFPNTDGVVGLRQECPGYPNYTFKWYGQTLMGRRFIERYRKVDYKICCPDYKHFYQDEEMYRYADYLGKFIKCGEALIYHYHPSFIKEELDKTHNIIRKGKFSPKIQDILTRRRRLDKGYLWGWNFELIN